MKKWLFFKIIYHTDNARRHNFVKYVEDAEVEDCIPPLFWLDESPSLEIYELSPDGQEKNRLELCEPFLIKQRDAYMRNIS
jgi:hypothetical protein